MKIYITIALLISINIISFSQGEEDYTAIIRTEAQLKSMFETLYNEEIIGSHATLFKEIDSLFFNALMLPGSYNYGWEKLDKIGKLKSDDGKIKVFSWLYMLSRNDYRYSAFVQLENNKGEYEVFKLEAGDSEDIQNEDYPQKYDDWHGKIYYDIITTEYKRKIFYTLIGADFNNTISSIKTIEVVTIQRNKPIFRGDQFLVGGTVKDRIVLEFSSDVSASVRYNRDLKMIVHDHLAPLHPIYYGNYQFYGPDGSYDGYTFLDGIWVLEEDVDARNNQ